MKMGSCNVYALFFIFFNLSLPGGGKKVERELYLLCLLFAEADTKLSRLDSTLP